jgi:hypothetical protein
MDPRRAKSGGPKPGPKPERPAYQPVQPMQQPPTPAPAPAPAPQPAGVSVGQQTTKTQKPIYDQKGKVKGRGAGKKKDALHGLPNPAVEPPHQRRHRHQRSLQRLELNY